MAFAAEMEGHLDKNEQSHGNKPKILTGRIAIENPVLHRVELRKK